MGRAVSVARALALAAVLPATTAAAYPHLVGGSELAGQLAARTATVPYNPSQLGHLGGGRPFVLGTVTKDLAGFDRAVHAKASLRMMFLRWKTPVFPQSIILRNASEQARTVIELQPRGLTMKQIAAGNGDAWLTSVFAPGIKAAGKGVVLSFAPEMNGQWYSYGFGRSKPADYVNAWRHVHNVLAASTAGPLITWLWQPSAIHFSTPSPVPWWPGSAYVDEIGLDGYYVLPQDNFQIIFAQTIKLVRALTSKPILVGETAIGATTGRAVADVRDLFAGIRKYHLLGLVWFNISQHAGKYHQDWRLQDHPSTLRAFIAALAKA
jgi:Glycosyl hydrolase family 26